MFTLNYVEEGVPREYVLPDGETSIGRAPMCDVVIKAPSVSRSHARIRVANGRCFLLDVGSRFGTALKGKPLEGETELAPGDMFLLGQQEMSIGQQVSEKHIFSELPETQSVVSPSATIDVAQPATEVPQGEGRLLKLLAEISKALVAGQPLPQVLARVVDLLFDVVPADRAFLLLRESPDEGLTARVVRNRDGTVPKNMTLSRTVVNRVMRDRVAMLGADARFDPRLSTSQSVYTMADMRSFMCAPLWNQSQVIGVLYCDTPKTGRFTEAALEIFAALSNYASVAIEQARLSEQLVEETRRRERLQRYHSPAVVNRILTSTASDDGLHAQERQLTVMFCDIVGFTKLSEGMTPTEIANLLNEYFTRMADVIFEHGGTLDKFIGDAVLAVFGAPFEQEDHAQSAVEAAIAMRQALAAFNDEQHGPPLEIRIAINTGVALTGDIGSPRRREFTVLGDVVNTASRIEALARPGQIVIARSTHDLARGAVVARQVGVFPIRGKEAPVELFEVLGFAGQPTLARQTRA